MKNFFVFGLLASSALFAASAKKTASTVPVNPQPAPTAAVSASSQVPAQNEGLGLLTGTLDVRPSYYGVIAETHTENWVDVGVKKGNFHLMYEQDFNTNIFNPGESTQGLDFTFLHGFFRAKFDNIIQSDDKRYSLSYEFRPFLPTWAAERDKGFITILRNYAKFAAKVSNSVTLSVWEAPAFHFYETSGYTNSDGGDSANVGFQNRVYLMADISFTEAVSLSFPILWYATKFRDYNAAKNSGTWDHYIWINPELDYALTPNYTLGLAWYNNTGFTASDLSSVDLSEGFKSGVAQVVFRATL